MKYHIKNIIKIQSLIRGYLVRKKLKHVSCVSKSQLINMIDVYIQYINIVNKLGSTCKLKYKKFRKMNFPSEISENLVMYAIIRKYPFITCIWDISKGDLIMDLYIKKYNIEVKAFSSGGPTSFGPTVVWDIIYFIDCRNIQNSNFKIYEIKLSNNCKIWKNIKVNTNETYEDHCNQKRRPRICFDALLLEKRAYYV